MINKHIKDLMELALNKMNFAEKELARPSEDSVTFTVCHSANNAIREFLVSLIAFNYAMEFPEEEIVLDTLRTIENWDIDFLKEYAAKLDPRFAGLDLTNLNCAGLEKEYASEVYCLSIETVRKCAKIAREVEIMVNEYINTTLQPKDNSELHRVIRSSLN
jgi:hypothetical protein